jgi:formylmethanofuran dehydrogenase subunit E
MQIGPYTFQEYCDMVQAFHGYPAPGVLIGGYMVTTSQRQLPAGTLYDAVCETRSCLPDAIQLLTPCSVGNGWLRVLHFGRYALSLYDKYTGQGWRIFLNPEKLEAWPEIKTWLFKLKPKKEQDTQQLLREIEAAGDSCCDLEPIQMQPQFLVRRSTGRIVVCPHCREPYPAADGSSCRACQGEAPYVVAACQPTPAPPDLPPLTKMPVEAAVGRLALHDMTHIVPGVSKGPALRHGQEIQAGDLCQLHRMGRYHVYVADQQADLQDWVHEDEAALAFAQALAGPGVNFAGPAREGKINLRAERDGLLLVDRERLLQFNLVEGVMCAGRQSFRVLREGQLIAGTRAIPLYLPRRDFHRALAVLETGPVFEVRPLRRASVGILVTGTEVFRGLIQDKFAPIIQTKVEQLGSRVLGVIITPDEQEAIRQGVNDLLAKGIDLLVTTAGLSVDPDDVTRQGLLDAGAADLLYGAPILPGAMTLLAHIGDVQVIGVPACALFFQHTSFDLLLPRLLAGLTLTRQDLAAMGHGAVCLECPTCTFPKCGFGC